MLAAEFHLSYEYIDEEMDLERFYGCLRYREFCPPTGALLKSVIEGLAGGKGDMNRVTISPTHSPSPAGGGEGYDGSLRTLIDAFGGWGGQIKVKKKDEGGEQDGG